MHIMSPHSKFYQTHLSSAEEDVLEKEDVKRLAKIVEESLEQIAKVTKLPVQEVLHIVEEVDVAQLKHATDEAIKKIFNATGLHRADIIAIFKEDKTATIDHVVHRLREESHVHRARI
jgi:hypothetical protein